MTSTTSQDVITPTSKTSFSDLATKFLSSYDDFDKRLQKSGILDHLGELTHGKLSDPSGYKCLITCGISGAGKSTLIARLISSLSSEDFWYKITEEPRDNNNVLHIDEGDVRMTLGGSRNATTLIPAVHRIGNTFVCDMPGFVDSSPVNDAIISILRKCLLTKIKIGRLLIIVDISKVLGDSKLGSLMSNYVEPLKGLVGEKQFADCLNHSHFVITHGELRPYTEKEVSMELRSAVFDLSDSNPLGASFLKRLEGSRTFTDYKSENNHQFLEKLKKLINTDLEANREKEALSSWKVASLAAGGDELNIRCQMELHRVLELIETEHTIFARLTDENSALQKSISESASSEIDRRTKVVNKIKLLEREKATLEEKNRILPGQMESDRAQLSKLANLTAVKRDQEEFIETGFAHHKVITVRIDHSTPDSRPTPLSPRTNSIELVLQVPDGEMAVIVIKEEGGTDALTQKIGSTDWVPESLSVINKLTADYVLYNGCVENYINRCNLKMTPSGRVRKIQAKSDEPFMVLVYRASPYLATSEFRELKRQFRDMLSSYELQRMELLKKIARNADELLALQTELKKNNDALSAAESEKASVEMVIQTHLSKLDASVGQIFDKLNGHSRKSEMLEMESNLGLARDIGVVFSKNNIEYNWRPQIEQAERNLTALIAKGPMQCENVETWAKGKKAALLECVGNGRVSPARHPNSDSNKVESGFSH